jgi:hypothetical protein
MVSDMSFDALFGGAQAGAKVKGKIADVRALAEGDLAAPAADCRQVLSRR